MFRNGKVYFTDRKTNAKHRYYGMVGPTNTLNAYYTSNLHSMEQIGAVSNDQSPVAVHVLMLEPMIVYPVGQK